MKKNDVYDSGDHSEFNNPEKWMNQLYHGDNLHVLKLLIKNGYKEKIDLIYIDPPFYSGLDFTLKTISGKRRKAYKDSWDEGLSQYLSYMKPRLQLIHEVLRDGGTLYVHLDWHVSHYMKVLLDEIFGYDNFQNQIIWKRLTYKQTQVKSYGVLHDVILYYTKGEDYTWNDIRREYDEKRLKKYFRWVETPDGKNLRLTKEQREGHVPLPEGRRFALNPLINPNPNRPNLTYEFLGFTKVWKYTEKKMRNYYEKGIVFQPSKGVLPQKKQYLDESKGMKLNDIFLDVGAVMGSSTERVDFDTQKPAKLLKRLIQVSSNPGDIVADFFSGSGTTLAVAEVLGRRWIGSELSRLGCQIIKNRLLSLDKKVFPRNAKLPKVQAPNAFSISRLLPLNENWSNDSHVYQVIISKLYGCTNILNDSLATAVIENASVHVFSRNKIIKDEDIEKLVKLFDENNIKNIIIIGQNWRLNPLHELDVVEEISIKFIQAPYPQEINVHLIGIGETIDEIAEDIETCSRLKPALFYELPRLTLEIKVKGLSLSLSIKDYVLNTNDPETEKKISDIGIKEKIVFFAVDWNYDSKQFRINYHSTQTKKDPNIKLHAEHLYPEKGNINIAVNIIDVLGHQIYNVIPITIT